MTNITIRKYQENDFGQICKIHDLGRKQELEIVNAEKYFTPLTQAPYRKDFFTCTILVASKNNLVIGFVAFHPHELDFLYVDPAYQGKGIGKLLAKAALLTMTHPITLNVFTENNKAKILYHQLGFVSQCIDYDYWSPNDPKKYSNEEMILK